MKKVKFDVLGMTCAACQSHVENAVKKIDGVSEVLVSLLTNSMIVTFDFPANEEIICEFVKRAGYDAKPSINVGYRLQSNEVVKSIRNLVASIALLLFLMYATMGVMMFGFPTLGIFDNNCFLAVYEAILSLFIILLNSRYYINGFKGVLHLAPNMDTLICFGSAISYIYSLYLVIFNYLNGTLDEIVGSLYFESAAMILVIISIGKLLETISKGKTTSAINSLLDLTPKTTNVVVDGEEVLTLVENVKLNDVFVLRAGDIVPVDGLIIEGSASINESSISGESLPSDKNLGFEVFAGSIILNGFIKCRATRVGKDTVVSQIVKSLEDISATKAPIAKIADKVASIFVPLVIAISILTFTVWMAISKDVSYSLTRAICVLVISCPCSLGLATPVAIMVGSGVAAKNGILFKTAESLEYLGKIDSAVFDKTGTLTNGKMDVCESCLIDDSYKDIIYSLESSSNHPIAKTISNYYIGCNKYDVENFEVLIGLGVSGEINGKKAYAGNLQLAKENSDVPFDMERKIFEFSSSGKTVISFVYDGKFLGIISLLDQLKNDAIESILELKSMNISVAMVTGDNRLTSEYIANEAFIDTVVAEVNPIQKVDYIKKLKENGNKVVMIGDGINDSAALAMADVGVAIGNATDIAVDSSEVVLIGSELKSLCNAITLSRKVLKNIKGNLFWAFFYNSICILIASGIFVSLGVELTPMMGAIAMSLSSVCVVLHSLMLNRIGFKSTTKIIEKDIEEETLMEKVLLVEGMMCVHCQAHVKEALEKVPGVSSVDVSLENKTATVKILSDVSNEALISAVENAGYKAAIE